MVNHASADSDISIVYFSLMINDKKKIIKAIKSKTIGEIVKSQLTEEYVTQNIDVFFPRPTLYFQWIFNTNFWEAKFSVKQVLKKQWK